MGLRSLRSFLHFSVFLVLAVGLSSCLSEAEYDIQEHYNKYEYRIPMRDGARLFTAVYVPKDRSRPYPFLMTRTPYSIAPYGVDSYPNVLGPHEDFPREGFIFVYQDVRGRFMSEGTFVNVRPYIPEKSGPQDVDESSDTYDTIEWLLENVPDNNGKVGIYGISYPGYYSAYALIDAHPALKAASPQAPIGDWFVGDDFHHNGAFYLQDAFSFFSAVGQPRPELTTVWPPRFDFGTSDAYKFFLDMGPLVNADKQYFHGEIRFWTDLVSHPDYDEFWQQRNIVDKLKKVDAAVMTVAGLFDAEDPYGPVKIYQKIEKESPGIHNTLVLGPWIHGGWTRTDGDRLGNVSFASKTGEYFRKEIDLPFFKHFLKEEGSPDWAEAKVFITGENRWREFDSWPPKDLEETEFFLDDEGSLTLSTPSPDGKESDEYVSDPAKPVPYTSEIRIRRSVEYMAEDQRFAARRPDVLVYQTEPLENDVTIVGRMAPEIYLSTTGTDSDLVVKVIDVFPENAPEMDTDEQYLNVPMGGYQMLVRGEVMRAKYRESYSNPEPLKPGEATLVRFDMPDIAHTFRRGHRIMVQVQSSWFPLVDRNPQTFVNIYEAVDSDFQKATVRIFHSNEKASRLKVKVLSH